MMITEQHNEESRPLSGVQPAPSSFEELRTRVTGLDQQARQVIRQRPIVALLAAVGVGYLTARLLASAARRRS
jgi:hypothetical protein